MYYLDKEFNMTSKEKSFYTGIGKTENGKFKFIGVVNKTNVVVLTGYFTDSSLTNRDGEFINYTDEGVELSRGVYVNNQEEGLWLRWTEGRLMDSIVYEKGDAVINTHYSYHPNGKKAVRNFKDNTVKKVEQTWWEADGTLQSYAKWIDGDGERITYHPNGQAGAIETYKNSKIVSTKYFTEDGTDMKDYVKKPKKKLDKENQSLPSPVLTDDKSAPEYPGGMAGFSSYFTKNFKAPQSLFEQVRSIERITLTFMLDKKGFANDIKILEFSSMELHEAIREVFNRMPPWNMKSFKSFGPVTYEINLQRGY